jgi:phage FluMu protein Com
MVMATVRCPSCDKVLNVSEKYAGKKVRCPGCQGVMTIPAAEAEAPVEVVPTPARPRRPMPPVPEDAPERRPASRRPPDDYDENYDRPRRRYHRRGGEWAECPHCGNSDATRVHWTFWGGLIGPAIINVVRCNECGTNYNGVHGDYNHTRILFYVLGSIVLGLIIAAAVIGVAIASNS